MALIVLVPVTVRVVMFVTAQPKLAVPVTIRLLAPPSTVLVKVTVLPVSVRPPDKVTAPVYACAPVVVMLALMVLVPLPVTLRLLRLVVPPTTPPKLTAPLPCAIVSACAPLTVLLKVTALLVVVSVVPAPRVTASL